MAGGGGTEPNLTPFIDLFSVLICFLLMTSAWIQLESMPSSIERPKTDAAEADLTPPPKPEDDKKKVKLAVTVFADKVVMKENENEWPVASAAERDFDKTRIVKILAAWKKKFPEKRDIVLNTDATITYGSMIKMYDLLVASDWPDVGINPQ